MGKVFAEWTWADGNELLMVIISVVVVYAAILVYTRIVGLRSFSKMSACDFAMTVAVGSLFASTVSSSGPPLSIGLVALGSLFAGQWALAVVRKFKWASKLIDNKPLLLMAGAEILDDNLQKANVTRADLFGKLREANATNFDQVLAVVFESTGDISVLHSSDADAKLDQEFVKDVEGNERLDVTKL